MEHGTRRVARKRRYLPGALVTLLWMGPAMLVTATGGFFLARYVLAGKYLQPPKVQTRMRAVRILSPEEAAKMAKDQKSHVWTEGVRDSDVPALAPTESSDENVARPRSRRNTPRAGGRHRASTQAAPNAPAEQGGAPANGAESTPDGTTNTAPPPGPAPEGE